MMKAQIQNSLFMVSEIKVSYQPKFNANEDQKSTSLKMPTTSCSTTGIRAGLR